MVAPEVDNLLEAIKQLPPDELAQFTARFTQWHAASESAPSDALLIQQTRQDLPAADQKQLTKLATKSERRQLTPSELLEYRGLAERAERLNAARVRALAELAHRRNQPIQVLMREIGWREPFDGR